MWLIDIGVPFAVFLVLVIASSRLRRREGDPRGVARRRSRHLPVRLAVIGKCFIHFIDN